MRVRHLADTPRAAPVDSASHRRGLRVRRMKQPRAAGHEAAGERPPAPGEPAQRRGAPLPLRDSLRAGLLLAELLFNVPADYACAQQVRGRLRRIG